MAPAYFLIRVLALAFIPFFALASALTPGEHWRELNSVPGIRVGVTVGDYSFFEPTPTSRAGVRRIVFEINGRPMAAPFAQVFDLPDPYAFTLERLNASRFEIRIEGGDTSLGYIAVITFDKRRVLGRKLFTPANMQTPYQETVYRDVIVP
jgi:hypothetical protein